MTPSPRSGQGRPLPPTPSLKQLKHQAKDLLKAHKRGDSTCCDVLRALRRIAEASDAEILAADVSLSEAQYALALSYGFGSWDRLKEHMIRQERAVMGEPQFLKTTTVLSVSDIYETL